MKTLVPFYHWLPRILCILSILFISMFALDAFAQDLTLVQQITDFLLHLIPSFVLLGILIVAWKWENIGGILFILLGLGFSPFIFSINYQRTHFSFWPAIIDVLIINIPFIIVGILFLISHKMRRKMP